MQKQKNIFAPTQKAQFPRAGNSLILLKSNEPMSDSLKKIV